MRFLLPVILFFSFIGTAQALTLHVVNDSYSDNTLGNKWANYGDEDSIRVNDTRRRGLIGFDITDLRAHYSTDEILLAKLRIYIKSIDTNGSLRFMMTIMDIPEDKISHNYFPYYGGPSAFLSLDKNSSETKPHSFVFVDVTVQLKRAMSEGFDFFDLAIQRDNMHSGEEKVVVDFASKESGWNAPQVEVYLKTVRESSD